MEHSKQYMIRKLNNNICITFNNLLGCSQSPDSLMKPKEKQQNFMGQHQHLFYKIKSIIPDDQPAF